MESSKNINNWFKSVFFVLCYSNIFDECKKYFDKTFLLKRKLLNLNKEKILKLPVKYKQLLLLNYLLKNKNVYALVKYKDNNEKYYKTNIPKLNDIILDVSILHRLFIINSNSNFANSLVNNTDKNIPYFELYIIYFLQFYCGLNVLDLLYLQSSNQNDEVYYYFHKYYNYNDSKIYNDIKYKNKVAKQKFNLKKNFKDYFNKNHLYFFKHNHRNMKNKMLDILVVSHYKYNKKLTNYYKELSEVQNNNLLKYSNQINDKTLSDINRKILILNINNISKNPIMYYSKKNKKTIITTKYICGTDIDLNKEFLLFACLLRNNNSNIKTKTIFAFIVYNKPEYEYEIDEHNPLTTVKVSYSINSQYYIDDTNTNMAIKFDWVTDVSNFKNETFIITEDGFNYEYNFFTGDKLLLYMNVFTLIYNNINKIQQELSLKFPAYKLQNSTYNDTIIFDPDVEQTIEFSPIQLTSSSENDEEGEEEEEESDNSSS